MKKYLLFAILNAIVVISFAQKVSPVIADSGSYLLHKFEQNIGKETYKINRAGNTLSYEINFKFVDRGSPVPLHAQLVTTNDHAPLSLFIKGSTSRFSTINDSIRIVSKEARLKVGDSAYSQALASLSFPVGGYSPGTVQMVLLRYWKKHHEPKSISMLPTGTVSITRDGRDTVSLMDQKLVLERYVLGGLVWGNEIIWTDKTGNLVCLITNDAEGDKLEMMQEQYEALLPELINRAAVYGMKLFTGSTDIKRSANSLLAIVGGNLVDVEGGQPISNSVIIIENGLVKQIGNTGSVSIPAKATVIHAEGKTILPGLWDMHAHFEQAEWGPAYLAAGVTTVRDCGNEFGYINAIKGAIDAHKGIGPNILKAGIIDGPGPLGLGIIRASTKEEAIRAVNMYKDNGFVQIKIYSSVTPAIVKAIAGEAHHLGLTVTGHIPQGMTLQQGVDSGMDQVNHMQYVYAVMKKNKDKSINLEDSANVAVLNYLVKHKVVIDPTMGVFEMIFRSVKDDITLMEPAYHTLPVPLQALFTNMGMPADQALTYKPLMQSMMSLVKILHDKGVPLVAGTDMGFPGYSLHRELELYVAAGLTPMEAIQAATIIPARVMHTDQQTGSIKKGKQADLVIIDGDPLQQIRNIRKVWMVIKEGQQYDPVTLHRLVGFKQ
ncbi:MAG: amidohydrolase family protein [Bacteroidota bacterium]